jgi:hypothetical protein
MRNPSLHPCLIAASLKDKKALQKQIALWDYIPHTFWAYGGSDKTTGKPCVACRLFCFLFGLYHRPGWPAFLGIPLQTDSHTRHAAC